MPYWVFKENETKYMNDKWIIFAQSFQIFLGRKLSELYTFDLDIRNVK